MNLIWLVWILSECKNFYCFSREFSLKSVFFIFLFLPEISYVWFEGVSVFCNPGWLKWLPSALGR